MRVLHTWNIDLLNVCLIQPWIVFGCRKSRPDVFDDLPSFSSLLFSFSVFPFAPFLFFSPSVASCTVSPASKREPLRQYIAIFSHPHRVIQCPSFHALCGWTNVQHNTTVEESCVAPAATGIARSMIMHGTLVMQSDTCFFFGVLFLSNNSITIINSTAWNPRYVAFSMMTQVVFMHPYSLFLF